MDYDKLDHDNGFKWLPTAVADYRMTGNKASRNRGLLAAANLAGRPPWNPLRIHPQAAGNRRESDRFPVCLP